MTRILLQYLLPLIGPLILYLIYIAFMRRAAAKKGSDAPPIERNHIFWSIVFGFFLMMVALTAFAIIAGEKPGSGKYQAPRMENGRITPPKFN